MLPVAGLRRRLSVRFTTGFVDVHLLLADVDLARLLRERRSRRAAAPIRRPCDNGAIGGTIETQGPTVGAIKQMAANPKNGRSDRNGKGQFKPGHPGGPGRPKGGENKSTVDARALRRSMLESFNELDDDGEVAGMTALRQLRADNPGTYLKLIASLLPPADPSLGESSSLNGTPLTTTSTELLAAIKEREGQPHDSMRGLNVPATG